MIKQRWKFVLAGLVAAVIGAVPLFFGIADLWTLVRGFDEARPVIASDRSDAASVLFGVFGLGVAGLFLFGRPVGTWQEQREEAGRPAPWAKRFLAFLLACIVGGLLAPTIQFALVAHAASTHGYRPCPPITWPRHQPDRWALPGPTGSLELCPAEGTSPNA